MSSINRQGNLTTPGNAALSSINRQGNLRQRCTGRLANEHGKRRARKEPQCVCESERSKEGILQTLSPTTLPLRGGTKLVQPASLRYSSAHYVTTQHKKQRSLLPEHEVLKQYIPKSKKNSNKNQTLMLWKVSQVVVSSHWLQGCHFSRHCLPRIPTVLDTLETTV